MLEGKELKITEDQISVVINDYMIKAQTAMAQVKEQEQQKFFAENGKKDGVNSTESGLQYRIEVPGNNEIMATAQDTVEVHYTGMLLDGTVFDSSVERGETAKFPLRAVIKGWTEGMQLVGEGGKIRLWIPYELGYGQRAMGPNLPAYSTLVFDVELIKVFKAAQVEEKEK
jgi:FKBP-type peptidyl-prolyl cis-trans isomerase FklB